MVATSSNGGDATPRPVAQTPSGAGAAATPATSPRRSVDIALPLRIRFRTENQGSRFPAGPTARAARARVSSTLRRPRRLSAARRTILCGLRMSCSVSPCRALCSPLAGKGTAQHWTAGLAVVVSGGLGMPDVHGRTNARDIKAAGNCDHAHVRVVTGRSTASIVRLLPTRVADAGLAS